MYRRSKLCLSKNRGISLLNILLKIKENIVSPVNSSDFFDINFYLSNEESENGLLYVNVNYKNILIGTLMVRPIGLTIDNSEDVYQVVLVKQKRG